MYRELITWDEAAEMLAPSHARPSHPSSRPRDEEALRQFVLTSRSVAFVELGDQFQGRIDNGVVPDDGESSFCSWECFPDFKEAASNQRFFFVQGWFALGREDTKLLVRGNGISGERAVRAVHDDFSLSEFEFEVGMSAHKENLWFRRADIERFKRGDEVSIVPATDNGKPARLRSDREENLLRVIAGLWALSGLPAEHNTTADKVSGLFDSWGWDKPAKSSMADTILKQAANLPGARIRT